MANMHTLYCGGCGLPMTKGDHSSCLGSRNVGGRRSYADKLERVQGIANDMLRESAKTPNREVMEALARWAEKINRTLEGEWT